MIACAIKDGLAVPRTFDRDRFLGSTLQRKRPTTRERCTQWIHIVQTFRTVESRMHENRIARLSLVHPYCRPVAAPFAIVSGLDADKAGLESGALMVGRVNVEDAPAHM